MYDSVKRQLISDVPIATFLSGGLDSSIITAIGAMEMKKKGERLSTYSFDYEDNNKYFKASHFQPDSDTKWVPRMVEAFNHKTIHILFARITCLRSFWRRHFWRKICRVWQT